MIDIRSEVRALAKALGIPHKNVQSITITPGQAEVVALKGKEPTIDPQTNEPAVETQAFAVRTS